MRKANLISGIALLITSILFGLWIIPGQIEETLGEEVSARLLPQICVIGIGLLSILLIVNNWRPLAEEQASPISRVELRAFAIIGGLLAAGIGVFMWLGPTAGALIVLLGIMLSMGERRPAPLLLIPATLLLGSYLLFYKVLGTAIV